MSIQSYPLPKNVAEAVAARLASASEAMAADGLIDAPSKIDVTAVIPGTTNLVYIRETHCDGRVTMHGRELGRMVRGAPLRPRRSMKAQAGVAQ